MFLHIAECVLPISPVSHRAAPEPHEGAEVTTTLSQEPQRQHLGIRVHIGGALALRGVDEQRGGGLSSAGAVRQLCLRALQALHLPPQLVDLQAR